MSILENLATIVLLLGLIMYALFAGADFGGGIWTAFAFGPRAHQQRESLFHAIGPVWETNHIWLVFVVVTLFMAFPKGFSVLFIALLVPFVIALIGINFRGAAFAFRHFGKETGRHLPVTAEVFEISSIVTPFALGIAVTAAAAGKILIIHNEVIFGTWSWVRPFTIIGGMIGMAICTYLAPIYMTVRTKGELRNDFRKAGMLAGIILGILTAIELPVALLDAPLFAQRLLTPVPLILVSLAVLSGITTQILLWRCKYFWSQIIAAGTVALTLAGFGASVYPDLIMGQLSLAAAAAPHSTLVAFAIILPCGSVILVPSLFFLYWTFRGEPNAEAPPGGVE